MLFAVVFNPGHLELFCFHISENLMWLETIYRHLSVKKEKVLSCNFNFMWLKIGNFSAKRLFNFY